MSLKFMNRKSLLILSIIIGLPALWGQEIIVEEEQDGKERAGYGKKVIKELSKVLTNEFGKGFSERNIEQMKQFYLVYSKSQTLSADFKNISQSSSTGICKCNFRNNVFEFQFELVSLSQINTN